MRLNNGSGTTPTLVDTRFIAICDNEENDYFAEQNAGSIYIWVVSDVTVTAGAGTWQISVHWASPETGTVTVTEMTNMGCNGDSETLDVNIDDCTGLGEIKVNIVQIYPNPASDQLGISGLKNAEVRIMESENE